LQKKAVLKKKILMSSTIFSVFFLISCIIWKRDFIINYFKSKKEDHNNKSYLEKI